MKEDSWFHTLLTHDLYISLISGKPVWELILTRYFAAERFFFKLSAILPFFINIISFAVDIGKLWHTIIVFASMKSRFDFAVVDADS